jgi:hypothetical protein
LGHKKIGVSKDCADMVDFSKPNNYKHYVMTDQNFFTEGVSVRHCANTTLVTKIGGGMEQKQIQLRVASF